MVFMRREYKMLALFCLVVLVVLWFTLGTGTVLAFVVGALCSGGAGYIGMSTATRANVRTTTAAHTGSAADALTVAFFGGLDHGARGRVPRPARSRRPVPLLRRRPRDPHTPSTASGWGASSVALFFPRRRRHLHQERGRRGGPSRQDRSRHPRGRPAQPRGDRGQRRRQRRRRGGHGLGHLRIVLRRDDRHHRDGVDDVARRHRTPGSPRIPDVPAARTRLPRPAVLHRRDHGGAPLLGQQAGSGAAYRDHRGDRPVHPPVVLCHHRT